jgi:hypothetical protein
MRNINSLANSKIEKAWAVNNIMVSEPVSTIEATKWVVHILDGKYEKADLQSVVSNTGHHLDSHKKLSCWSC